MARKTVDQGLAQLGANNYGIGAVKPVNAMCLSNFGTLGAGVTTVASATNKVCNALLATPVPAGTKVTSTAKFTAAQIDGKAFTNITLHFNGAGAFDGLYGGIDGQSFTFTGVDITVDVEDTFTST